MQQSLASSQREDPSQECTNPVQIPQMGFGQGAEKAQQTGEASDGANNKGTTGAQPATKEVKTKGHIVIPYTQGLCESIKKICGRYGIQTYFKSCDDEYVGETSRTFGERCKGHLKDPSPIHEHSNHTGHPTSHNNFQIIGREGHSLARNIKESIFITVKNPTLNRNIDKFNLPHIWDRVLLKTPGLSFKRYAQVVGHVNSII